MDPLSITVSIVALIEVATSISRSCTRYAKSVGSAREDVASLKDDVVQFTTTLERLAEQLNGPGSARLGSAISLKAGIENCRLSLTALDKKLDLGHPQKAMSRLGIRALKWPFKLEEMESIKKDLERYRAALNLVLQVDQTELLNRVSRQTENISQKLDIDNLPAVPAAEFDSYVNQHETECLPGTRTRILHQINEWGRSPEGEHIFWLNGMAGSGKSTISRTVCSNFKSQGVLGASFFFKRGEGERGKATKFITTISSQLATNVPTFKTKVSSVLDSDPQISERSFREQFDKLLLQPFSDFGQESTSKQTVVLVIDALDECEPSEDVRLLLQLLPGLSKVGSFDLRVFLTSRPELPIRLGLIKNPEAHRDLVLHEIPQAEIRHDISLFFQQRFLQIRKDRDLPTDWPGDDNFQKLVTMSLPLFVFAATICRVLEDPQWDPDESLSEVLTHQNEESKMGATYLPIFNQLLANQTTSKKSMLIQQLREVLGTAILLRNPMTVASISHLISIPQRVVRLRFNALHSIFNVPESDFEVIRPFHLSLREFLLDPATRTKTPLWVDAKAIHSKLSKDCLTLLRDGLKQNILDLPDYGTTAFLRRRRDVRSIEKDIPRELMYSFLNWAYHFIQSSPSEAEISEAAEFLAEHFLHWLEALFSVDGSRHVRLMLRKLQPLFEGHDELVDILEDGVRFYDTFRELAHNVPLQLYSSALVFSPSNSAIPRRYSSERLKEIRSLPQVPDSWDVTQESPLEGFGGEDTPGTRVQVLEFSPNGKLVASGCRDGTIALWDPLTGTLEQTLRGHSDKLNNLSFSPSEDKLLATSSYDKTVRLWDITTGAILHTLHQPALVSVLVFPPAGQLLASAAGSNGVYLYDSTSGALKHSLTRDSYVWAATFSPDSQLLATSSDYPDKAIQLWDVADGTVRYRLKCDMLMTSLAFSPDGKSLISVVYQQDRLQLWDLPSGNKKYEFYMRLYVDQAKFSVDGTKLVTNKGTIDIHDLKGDWNYHTPDKRNTVLMEKPWITVNGNPIMCLLRGHEPSAFVIKNDVVALGFRSGQVLFIGFDRGDATA